MQACKHASTCCEPTMHRRPAGTINLVVQFQVATQPALRWEAARARPSRSPARTSTLCTLLGLNLDARSCKRPCVKCSSSRCACISKHMHARVCTHAATRSCKRAQRLHPHTQAPTTPHTHASRRHSTTHAGPSDALPQLHQARGVQVRAGTCLCVRQTPTKQHGSSAAAHCTRCSLAPY